MAIGKHSSGYDHIKKHVFNKPYLEPDVGFV